MAPDHVGLRRPGTRPLGVELLESRQTPSAFGPTPEIDPAPHVVLAPAGLMHAPGGRADGPGDGPGAGGPGGMGGGPAPRRDAMFDMGPAVVTDPGRGPSSAPGGGRGGDPGPGGTGAIMPGAWRNDAPASWGAFSPDPSPGSFSISDSRAHAETPAQGGTIAPADSGAAPAAAPNGPAGRPSGNPNPPPASTGGGNAVVPAPAPPIPALVLATAPAGGSANGPGAGGGPAGQVAAGPGAVVANRGVAANAEARGPDLRGGAPAGLGDALARGPGRGDEEVREGASAADAYGPGAEVPDPEAAGPRTAFSPFDRASLEQALDRVLDELGGLGDALPAPLGPAGSGLAPATLALAAGALVAAAAHRARRRRGEGLRPDGAAGLAFPGLPGSWDGSAR